MSLILKVKRTVEQEGLIGEGEGVLVAVSGGIDSVALFHVLFEISRHLPFRLAIAHVNHLLRGSESKRDEEFVRTLADTFSVPFFLKRVDTSAYARIHGLSIQQAARDLRYAFLEEVAEKESFQRIAIGHTLDDQVETFLLRLAKGTGLRGLTAIPMKRGKIIRPFLFVKRGEIEAYQREKGISYVEDSSNLTVHYQRNYVRHKIIPLFESLNPAFKEKVISLLEDLTSINGMFERKIEEEMAFVERREGEIILSRERLLGVDKETRFRLLSRLLAEIDEGLCLTRRKLRIIEKMAESKRPNLYHKLKDGLYIKRAYGKISITKRQEKTVEEEFPLCLGEHICEPLGIRISLELLDRRPEEFPRQTNVAFFDGGKIGRLMLRTMRKGDRFIPFGMKEPTKIKDFFIRLKIPRDERKRIPILFSDDRVMWVLGLRTDERFKIGEHTRRVLKVSFYKL